VRKSDKGWGIGRHVYQVAPDNGVIDGAELAIACSHQDQVIAPPAAARTILSSAFTPYAGLLYESGTTLSVQPHPEFDAVFARELCDLRSGLASDDVVTAAKASLVEPLDSARLGGAIARFLMR
jgi:GMP synthase-like glutamine amidotransferase